MSQKRTSLDLSSAEQHSPYVLPRPEVSKETESLLFCSSKIREVYQHIFSKSFTCIMEMAHLLFLPSYGDEAGCDFCLSIISIFFWLAASGMRKLEGNVRSWYKRKMNSNMKETVMSPDSIGYNISALKLLLIFICSFLISFSVFLDFRFYHFIIFPIFSWKRLYFHFKGMKWPIQDLMGTNHWDSGLLISCSFRLRTGKHVIVWKRGLEKLMNYHHYYQ